MPAPIIPWEPSNVPEEIQLEIERRKKNISFNFVSNTVANFDSTAGEWSKYRGPMNAWIRLCSNGRGAPDEVIGSDGKKTYNYPRERFVMYGGKNFMDTYGFASDAANEQSFQIIGYKPDGTPHKIINDTRQRHPIHVPTPEIIRVDTTVQRELIRKATIQWNCFSWKQLEYLTPYLLSPGISVMLELGWNHYNVASLVNIDKDKEMTSLLINPYPLYTKNILDSRGNYDVIYGIVTGFNWSVDGNNKFSCTTEVMSKNRLYAGLPTNVSTTLASREDSEEYVAGKELSDIRGFFGIDNQFQNFRTLARLGPDKFLEKDAVITTQKSPTNQKGGNKPTTPVRDFFHDIISGTEQIQDKTKKKLRKSYLHGIFDGRDPAMENVVEKKTGKDVQSDIMAAASFGSMGSAFASVNAANNISKNIISNTGRFDFDKDQVDGSKVWMSMGLVVTILNYFSKRVFSDDEYVSMEIDIDNSRISGHPNLISADGSTLLIPNEEAPKYFVGVPGLDKKDCPDEYINQYIVTNTVNRPADKTLREKMIQTRWVNPVANTGTGNLSSSDVMSSAAVNANSSMAVGLASEFAPKNQQKKSTKDASKFCVRQNLDEWINRLVYNNGGVEKGTRCFPAKGSTTEPNPDTTTSGHSSDVANICFGYLRDLYVNYNCLKKAVEDPNMKSFYDVVKKLLSQIASAADDYWSFELADAGNGKLTIIDKNFVAKPGGKMLKIDMYDASSVVKSFRFRPQLSDAQATRTIYASNPESNIVTTDGIVDMNFKFTDKYNVIAESKGKNTKLENRIRSSTDWFQKLQSIQQVDVKDNTVQMRIPRPGGKFEYLKFDIPPSVGRSFLSRLLKDDDYESNSKYCAIQSNINAELTLQGIGGFRTYQWIQITNLPEPYSDSSVIFQVINIVDHVEGNNWDTTLVLGIRPLRGLIKKSLGL